MRILILSILILVLLLTLSYAGNLDSSKNTEEIKAVVPELIREGQFTYARYEDSAERLEDVLGGYREGRKIYWEFENIGIPNWLLSLKGYGLVAQKEIVSLKLENAKLKGETKEERAELEQQLKEIEKQILVFLSTNTWVD